MFDPRRPCVKCGKRTLIYVGNRPYCAECFVKATDRYVAPTEQEAESAR